MTIKDQTTEIEVLRIKIGNPTIIKETKTITKEWSINKMIHLITGRARRILVDLGTMKVIRQELCNRNKKAKRDLIKPISLIDYFS